MRKSYGISHDMATIDRRLARERAYETTIANLKVEVARLRYFLGLIAKPISVDVILSDDFHKAAARELGARMLLASAGLRGSSVPKESPAEAGPPLVGSETGINESPTQVDHSAASEAAPPQS